MRALFSILISASFIPAAIAAAPEQLKTEGFDSFNSIDISTFSTPVRHDRMASLFRVPDGCPKGTLDNRYPLSDITGPLLRDVSQLPGNKLPEFNDDMDRNSLLAALNANLEYWNARPDSASITVAGVKYNAVHMRKTTKALIDLFSSNLSQSEIRQKLVSMFTIYESKADDGSNKITATGYYEADIQVTRRPDATHIHPLYLRPAEIVKTTPTQDFPYDYGTHDASGNLVPYFTREEIVNGALNGRDLEIVWSAHQADIMLLQIQGSGYVSFDDGTSMRVGFDGLNGWPFRSVQRILMDCGEIPSMNFKDFISYLKSQEPDRETRLVNLNPRYAFFKTKDDLTSGAMGRPLTPGRSIAVDPQPIPYGLTGLLISRHPVADENGNLTGFQDFSRFVASQDTGSAIRGPGRLDLFWGGGKKAEAEASSMKATGRLFLFVLK